MVQYLEAEGRELKANKILESIFDEIMEDGKWPGLVTIGYYWFKASFDRGFKMLHFHFGMIVCPVQIVTGTRLEIEVIDVPEGGSNEKSSICNCFDPAVEL